VKNSSAESKHTVVWWQNTAIVGLLVAIVAAVPPVTSGVQGYFNAKNQLDLERAKQTYEIRQKYLDRVLSDAQDQKVLQFLVAVEEDQKLKSWALERLKETDARIGTKLYAYRDAISTVALLANQQNPIDRQSRDFMHFWSLYNEDLLPFESREVEGLMVQIGHSLNALADAHEQPTPDLRNLSFQLARAMKQELQ
jgi:hypothetical protein